MHKWEASACLIVHTSLLTAIPLVRLRIAMHVALFLAVITEVVMIVVIGLRAWKRHRQQQQVMPWTSLILREGILHFV